LVNKFTKMSEIFEFVDESEGNVNEVENSEVEEGEIVENKEPQNIGNANTSQGYISKIKELSNSTQEKIPKSSRDFGKPSRTPVTTQKKKIAELSIKTRQLNEEEKEEFIRLCRSYQCRNWCKKDAYIVFFYDSEGNFHFHMIFDVTSYQSLGAIVTDLRRSTYLLKYISSGNDVSYKDTNVDWNRFLNKYINLDDKTTKIYEKKGNEITLIKPSNSSEDYCKLTKEKLKAEKEVTSIKREKIALKKKVESLEKKINEQNKSNAKATIEKLRNKLNRANCESSQLSSNVRNLEYQIQTLKFEKEKIEKEQSRNENITAMLFTKEGEKDDEYHLWHKNKEIQKKFDEIIIQQALHSLKKRNIVLVASFDDKNGYEKPISEQKRKRDKPLTSSQNSEESPSKKQRVEEPSKTDGGTIEQDPFYSSIFSLLDKGREKIVEKQKEFEYDSNKEKIPSKDLLYNSKEGNLVERTVRESLNSIIAESIYLGQLTLY